MITATAIAPGKIMLAGEYAVLDGGRALAAAIDGTFSVQCIASPSASTTGTTTVTLESAMWANPVKFSSPGEMPKNPDAHNFARAAVAALGLWKTRPERVTFKATGNLDPSLGAGSSSALRLTTLAAALRNVGGDGDGDGDGDIDVDSGFDVIEKLALQLQRDAQPAASGYDLAVQRRGGVIEFRRGESRQLGHNALDALAQSVVIMCGGAGAPTGSTMQSFMSWMDADKKSQLMKLSEIQIDAWLEWFECCELGNERSASIQKLMDAVSAHRSFMADSPVFPTRVAKVLEASEEGSQRWTWKPTGAGGEDSVLLIGPAETLARPIAALEAAGWKKSPMPFTRRGLQVC